MDRQLPDTPWHVGYAKKKADDPRRHKNRCVNNKQGMCHSTKTDYYRLKCPGSSHCRAYAETIADYEELLANNATIDDIATMNKQAFRKELEIRKRNLARAKLTVRQRKTGDLRECLVCHTALLKVSNTVSLKKCPFCNMYYVNFEEATNAAILDAVKANEVFIMNINKKS